MTKDLQTSSTILKSFRKILKSVFRNKVYKFSINCIGRVDQAKKHNLFHFFYREVVLHDHDKVNLVNPHIFTQILRALMFFALDICTIVSSPTPTNFMCSQTFNLKQQQCNNKMMTLHQLFGYIEKLYHKITDAIFGTCSSICSWVALKHLFLFIFQCKGFISYYLSYLTQCDEYNNEIDAYYYESHSNTLGGI